MKSKTSFFNKGLFFSNIKRYGWVSLVWAALLFLAVPLTMMTYDIEREFQGIDNINLFMSQFGGVLSNLMLCGFPVLIGVLMFRYLHSPRSATVLHGLPFSRPRLFANGIISGFVLMLVPFLLNGIIILSIKATMPVGAMIEYTTIFIWLLNSICFAFVVFALTVFVGMFTGNMMAHFVFTYIIHFLPIGLWMLFNELFSSLVYGYAFVYPPQWLVRFPMTYFSQNTFRCNAAYAIAGVVLLVLAMLVYRKRPLENASDIVVFKFVRPVFKYGVTFCCAITGYSYFSLVMGMEGNIVLALVFTAIGYIIAQMLLQKTWRIWKSYKGLLVSFAVILVFWGAIEFDVTGYERRIPDIADVESVTVNGLAVVPANSIELKDEADITPVYDMHKKLMENEDYKANKWNPGWCENFSVCYKLKNGTEMSRMYRYVVEEYTQEIGAIYDRPKVKAQAYAVIAKTADDFDAVSIYVRNEGGGGEEYRITDKAQINDILNVFKVDVNHISAADIFESYDEESDGPHATITFELRPEPEYLPVEGAGDSSSLRKPSASITQQSVYSYEISGLYENTTRWFENYAATQAAQ